MPAIIEYDGVAVFAGHPAPLISKSVNFVSQGDTRTHEEHTLTLRGELTGCGIDELLTARQLAINTFSESFKDLYVSGIDTFTGVKIESVSFDDSAYLSVLPYTITLNHYPSGSFDFYHGVTNPVNQWTYTESENQIVSITNTVSAQGLSTEFSQLGGNALDNAKSFVTSQLTGAWEIPRPYLIDTKNTEFQSYLTSFNESVDKITNTVSVNRTFVTDPQDVNGNIILRYSEQVQETEGQQTTISYDGTIDAGATGYIKNAPSSRESSNLSDIRSRYTEFKNSLDATDFLSERVTEDTGINRLTFSISYNSGDTEPSIIDDFNITVSENSDSSLFSVSIDGDVSAKHGCEKTFEEIKSYHQGDSHKFQICDEIYKNFYKQSHGSKQERPTNVVLNVKPLSTSKTENEKARTLSYSASYNDRNLLRWQEDPDVNSVSYDMSFAPPVQVVKSSASALKGGYIFQDLGYKNRSKFTISSSSSQYIPSGEYLSFAKSQFTKMTDSPEDIILSDTSYEKNIDESTSLNFSRSFNSQFNVIDVDTNYTGIDDLRV